MSIATYPAQPFRSHNRMNADSERRAPRKDPADFAEILEKHDDRLIRDIGLTRDEITGPSGSFWSSWEKGKSAWQL